MSFFHQARPRRYHHTYMYVDERKQRLQCLEVQAKREMEQDISQAQRAEEARHDLSLAINDARHRREARRPHFQGVVLWLTLLVLALAVLCFCLMAAV